VNKLPTQVNATFCASVVDQWIREGLSAVFVAPGSRSTPLALAFAQRALDGDVALELFHDERSASFAALGHGLATQTPAVLFCTSGTAAAHFFAAVIEADLSSVPLIVCTADRPPELWGRGAPQTIDQTNLFGDRVRAFGEPGPPDDLAPDQWRAIAQGAWKHSVGPTPGPVHLNLSFRDPLTGAPDVLPAALAPIEPESANPPDATMIADLVTRLEGNGVIIAGRGQTDPALVLELARRLQWPVLADHRSGCRSFDPAVIHRFDSLLRHARFASTHRPDVVLRVGEIVSSKACSQWLMTLDADVIATRPWGRLVDPEAIATANPDEIGFVAAVLEALGPGDRAEPDWLNAWRSADDLAETAIASTLIGTELSTNCEIAIARTVIEAVPQHGALVVASSMPVRDVEWFGPPRSDIAVYSNRGANGIDGTIATAIGVAATGTPTICLVGDVAALHDSTSFVALGERDIDLTIVIVNNDGGGIFSFLPQHEVLDGATYELLFGTPHGADFERLAAAHGIETARWPTALSPQGVRVVIATSSRAENLARHDNAHAAVAAALD